MRYALPSAMGRSCLAGSLLLLTACAGYNAQTGQTVSAMQGGSIDGALRDLDSKNTGQTKDLLYFLERGELLRMKGVYSESRDQWLVADERVRMWEDQAKKDPSKLFGDMGAYVLNDTTRRYDGRDFEKVFLNVRLALDHVALGDWDNARTEIKKMHEREAIVATFHAKEVEAAKKAAKDKGLTQTTVKELDGYPVETLQDPQVQALVNAYESAFANYLAGFVYEALGEPSLAAAGYRKAAEMRPNVPMVDEGLRGLDSRVRRKTKMVDTLVVIESGTAPAITSKTLPILLPVPSRGGVKPVLTPISWPVIVPSDNPALPASIVVDRDTVPIVTLTNVDLMARRSLSDEMPSIIVRSSVRAIVKAGVVAGSTDAARKQAGAGGALLDALVKTTVVATEVADERSWRTLPGAFSIARIQLPEGAHKVSMMTRGGLQTADVNLGGRYAIVSMRTSGAALYVTQSPSPDAKGAVAVNPR